MKKHHTLLSRTLLLGRQERVPVWFMRQAGRYLPEYRKLKQQQQNFMRFCRTPELCVEATLQPLKRFSLDGAIIFSDILVLPEVLGQKVCFEEGKGLKLTPIDWIRLKKQFPWDSAHPSENKEIPSQEMFLQEKLGFVYEICRMVRAALPRAVECIGFAGAPWTLACYMLEGGSSPTFSKVISYGFEHTKSMDWLIDVLSSLVAYHLVLQARNGAGVLQIFDSLAGNLPPEGFERWCVKPFSKIMAILRENHVEVPVIGFPRRSGFSLSDFCQKTKINALSLPEWTCLSQAKKDLESQKRPITLQGNLHPALLLKTGQHITHAVEGILRQLHDVPHIFNLGHGILPQTCYDAVSQVIDDVQAYEHTA